MQKLKEMLSLVLMQVNYLKVAIFNAKKKTLFLIFNTTLLPL